MDRQHGLVDDPLATRLERTCRTILGDDLRSITYFTTDAFEQVYLRSDLAADADLAAFAAHEAEGFDARQAYSSSELGAYEHTLHTFENGFVTRVTVEDDGVFATADGLTVRRSREVADALATLLADRVEEEPAPLE